MLPELLALPQLSMLEREHCEYIHLASLEILRRTGVRVYHQEALDLLSESGNVALEGNLVRFLPGIVEWAIEQAPSRVPLCRRGSDDVLVPLEGKRVSFGTGSDCLTYLDPRSGERRPFESQDVIDCIHIVDAMPNVEFCMSMGVPVDHGPSPFMAQYAMMLEHTDKPIVFVCHDRADAEAILAMAAVASGGPEKMRMHPPLLLYTEPSSPLRHTETAVGKLLLMAEEAIPVVHSPAPVQGGTAMVPLAGAMAQANAEILSGLVMHQLKRAGAPFVYGSGMHHLDMQTTISLYTCPEFMLARVMVAEMGRYYGLPTWGYAGDANSCVVDEQAAAEGTFSILISLLAGNNLTHDIGYLESGKTTSPEMIVLCDEIIDMLRKFMRGVKFDQDTLAMDVIHSVGPDGDYLSSEHTLSHFRDLWRPKIFNRLGGEAWTMKGGKRTGEILREKTVSIIEEYQPKPLPDGVKEEIDYILRSSEGGTEAGK
jgi:trimethylamine--corrinoid protein Co-methyltransferase